VSLSLDDLLLNLVMIAIFLGIAFPVHEFAHAWVAFIRGDATAKLFGRMTLNPVVHFDPIGGLMTVISIFLGGFLIGWAKPTPVNTNNLRNRRNDEVLVALAGPASNLVMAVLGAIVVRVVFGSSVVIPDLVALGLVNFVVFNVMLAVFNLIPIPPLDGSRVMTWLLPSGLRDGYRRLEGVGLLLVVLLIFYVPGFQRLLTETMNTLLGAMDSFFSLLGVGSAFTVAGSRLAAITPVATQNPRARRVCFIRRTRRIASPRCT